MPKPTEEDLFRMHGVERIPGVSPNWHTPKAKLPSVEFEPPARTSAAHPCEWPTGCWTIVDGERRLCRFHTQKLREQEAQP